MHRRIALVLLPVFLFLALVGHAHATNGSFMDQFLGNPLLVLVAIVIIDGIAFAYHRIRK